MPDDLSAVVSEERRLLENCCRIGPVIVDVPIDLQCLPKVVDRLERYEACRYWQLVMRPVDFALNGLKPLADNIGFPVARLANVLSGLAGSKTVVLGETLFETYPAASLDFLKETYPSLKYVYDKYRFRKALLATKRDNWPSWVKGYVARLPEEQRKEKEQTIGEVVKVLDVVGGQTSDEPLEQLRMAFQGARSLISRQDKPPYKGGVASWSGCRWSGAETSVNDAALADLMNVLVVVPAAPGVSTVTADDFDAVICSLVGVLPECALPKESLEELVESKVGEDCGCALVPEGYHLLSCLPKGHQITLNVKPLDSCEAVCAFVEGFIGSERPPEVAAAPVTGQEPMAGQH
jgi:hypothetical protein